jgi:hypothetical protein
MIYNYPTLIVDNFFKDPNEVRKLALSQEFLPSPDSRFAGVRTKNLYINYPKFYTLVCRKILDCYSIRFIKFSATMHFHWTGEEFNSECWVHRDNNPMVLSSIIYLNETNNSIDNGTGLYKLSNLSDWDSNTIGMRDAFSKPGIKDGAAALHNQSYSPILKIGNLYNRMVSYDASMPHTGEGYFGNTKDTGRLTLVTFFKEITSEDNYTPLQRAETFNDL